MASFFRGSFGWATPRLAPAAVRKLRREITGSPYLLHFSTFRDGCHFLPYPGGRRRPVGVVSCRKNRSRRRGWSTPGSSATRSERSSGCHSPDRLYCPLTFPNPAACREGLMYLQLTALAPLALAFV